MRLIPFEGPRIYLEEGKVGPGVVVHEYGHYAAGYVYGHMDVALDGFDATNCRHRSFQEMIADIFKHLFLHGERHDSPDLMEQIDTVFSDGLTSAWSGLCGANANDSAMGGPVIAAVIKVLWGTAPSTSLVEWSNAQSGNEAMVDAFAYALALNRSHDPADIVNDMLDRLETTHPARFPEIQAVFQAHALGVELGDSCSDDGSCRSNRCDAAPGNPRNCIPNDHEGELGEYCTHNHHCQGGRCTATPGDTGVCE